MKKALLTKLTLLLCALIAGSTSAWATVTWDRVSSVSTLTSGGTFIIGYEATANSGVIVPMANTGSATTSAAGYMYSGATAADGGFGTIDMSTVTNTSSFEVVIGASSEVDGAIYIKIGDNYLGNTNTKNNCKLFTTQSATTSFTPTIGDNNTFTLDIAANTSGSAYRYFKYNSSNPRFAVYATTPDKIVIYKKNESGTPTCATPTISPASGAVLSGTEVTLITTTEGATIYYTMGADPADPTTSSTPYDPNNKPTITAATTIKAIAVKDGSNNSTVASASYTIVTPLSNIAALTENTNTSAETKYVTITDAVVTFTNGSYAYIQDASGAVLYYKSGHGLTAGDVLNGTATVTYQLRNSNPQITALSGVTPTTGGAAPDPTEVAQSAWGYTFNNVLSQYFKITGAIITSSDSKYYVSLGGENVQLYKIGTALGELNLTKKYTITGFPTLYNTTKELYIFATPDEEVSTDPIIAATPTSRTGFTYTVGEGPSTAQKISVSGSNLTENISLSLGVSSNFEMSLTGGNDYTNSLTLSPTTGSVSPTDIYVRLKAGLAISDSYAGTITVTSAGVDNVEVTLAGSVTPTNFTWDLSTNSYDASPTENQVTWTGTYATMTNDKGSSSTVANSYLGGDANNRTSTRFYGNHILTITPKSGYGILSVVFTATSDNYATALKNSTLSNATAAVSSSTVTITPTNGALPISATIGGACGFTAVKVYYEVANSVTLTPVKTYTTLTSSHNLDFTGIADLEAYIATGVAGGYVQMAQVNKVPAGTGLVLKATTPGSAVNVPVFDGTSPSDVSGNKMAGSATATTAIAANAGYILSDGIFQPASKGTLAAGKAYLDIAYSPTAPVLNLSFDGDDVTGIADVRSKMEDVRGDFFDLQGRKVAQPTKGLYIVNGKKYVVK